MTKLALKVLFSDLSLILSSLAAQAQIILKFIRIHDDHAVGSEPMAMVIRNLEEIHKALGERIEWMKNTSRPDVVNLLSDLTKREEE